MIDLNYWTTLSEQKDKNWFAIYWTTKNVFVPLPEKEVLYDGWVYEISGKAYEGLYEARTHCGYPADFTGNCKSRADAQEINGYFLACANSIVKEITSYEKENRVSETVKKVRHI